MTSYKSLCASLEQASAIKRLSEQPGLPRCEGHWLDYQQETCAFLAAHPYPHPSFWKVFEVIGFVLRNLKGSEDSSVAPTDMDLESQQSFPLLVECVPGSDKKAVCVSHNGSLTEFMNNIPRAAYTTFVSLHSTGIPQLGFHVDRIIQGVSKLYPNAIIPSTSSVMNRVCSIVDDAFSLGSQVGHELQFVSALVEGANREIVLRVHVSRIKSFDQSISPVSVECRGKPRRDPHVKNSAWYRERKPLQSLRAKEAYETILVGKDSHGNMALLEGLVSNFFVITKDMQVYTAPTDVVLPGSTRRLVLRACEELSVTVREEAPRLIDWRRFAIGFLTNARTWLLPVSCILVPLADHREKGVQQRLELPAQDRALELLEGIRQVVYNLAFEEAYVPCKFGL